MGEHLEQLRKNPLESHFPGIRLNAGPEMDLSMNAEESHGERCLALTSISLLSSSAGNTKQQNATPFIRHSPCWTDLGITPLIVSATERH